LILRLSKPKSNSKDTKKPRILTIFSDKQHACWWAHTQMTKEAQHGNPTAIQGNSKLLPFLHFQFQSYFILMLSIDTKFCRLGIFRKILKIWIPSIFALNFVIWSYIYPFARFGIMSNSKLIWYLFGHIWFTHNF
jgi:hypothetical protein